MLLAQGHQPSSSSALSRDPQKQVHDSIVTLHMSLYAFSVDRLE